MKSDPGWSFGTKRAERAGLAGWQPICFIDEERMGAKELAAAVVGDVFHVGSKMHRFSTPPSSKKGNYSVLPS
ncbi:unnamed protein product [Gadus morhua 'NCC']